ncbi:MAG: tRNA-dihydrouridine synthase family protein [Bacteroides sp.]|nr:tRNA-dihydrouridine synthase family protein [Bacteroides sp.]
MNFHFAPVQGHTDAPYRHFHSEVYGGALKHYTPFIRLEKDGIRQRDVKDYTSQLNRNIDLTPQIIFRDKRELETLITQLREKGISSIDLNMGCPFPLQTGHGRGAATIGNNELAHAVVESVQGNPDITFSVKMRLGLENKEEWRGLIPYLNKLKLSHITLHPRTARQQYGGEIDFEQFGLFLKESNNPVVYNGDLRTPEDITKIIDSYPDISGVMIGRGLLGRPSLMAEYLSGAEWPEDKRKQKMLEFHRLLLNHYQENLCGEAQIISKISPFWEYAEAEIGRKGWKAIRKASNMAKYNSAVGMIANS